MPAHLGILLAIFGGALGQLLMKSGLQSVELSDWASAIYSVTQQPLSSSMVLAGIACYVMSMFVWVHTLKSHTLNQAIPYLSFSYVVVYLLATFWPGIEEPVTLQKTIGVCLIMIGVWFTQSSSNKPDT